MNKITKKLFISIITWLMIFVTLGASTYAWFSMNYTARASGLNIYVQSNATYLLIGTDPNIALPENKIGLTKEVEALYVSGGDQDKKVYPAFYGDGFTILGTEEKDKVLTEKGKWYTAHNLESGHPTNKTTNVKKIDSFNESYYMLTYKVYLTFSGDSLDYNKQLKVSFEKITGDDAVSAVVIIGEDKMPVNVDNSDEITEHNVFISSTTALEVTILLYLNGVSENVYSDYYNTHNGLTGEIKITFGLFV